MKVIFNLATLIWNACCEVRCPVSEEIGVLADRSGARSLCETCSDGATPDSPIEGSFPKLVLCFEYGGRRRDGRGPV
jgi:hypothetical protein